jgi:hypothetical protein
MSTGESRPVTTGIQRYKVESGKAPASAGRGVKVAVGAGASVSVGELGISVERGAAVSIGGVGCKVEARGALRLAQMMIVRLIHKTVKVCFIGFISVPP